MLNAIDRLWQEHLYAMDALREAVGLRQYGQKDPLIEYKNEGYEIFVELMGNIKNEVLNNLFRSTTNLMAFEKFLAGLPAHLLRQEQPHPPRVNEGVQSEQVPHADSAAGGRPEEKIDLNLRRELPKAGRNDPCPCGSGKKYKNCCGRTA